MDDFIEPTRYEDFYGQKLNSWFMSEKLHGIWARWTGEFLVSRNGKRFNAPKSFIEGLPSFQVEGELFLGYGPENFQRLCGLVKCKNNPDWSGITFNLFDSTIEGIYAERYGILKGLQLPDHVKVIEQFEISSDENRKAFLNAVMAKGGEGLVLRNPAARYIPGITNQVKKDKPLQHTEVVCLGVKEGKGKLEGFIGSLACEFNGVVFGVPNLPHVLLSNAKEFIGKRITVSFFGFTERGALYQPDFVGVRDYE